MDVGLQQAADPDTIELTGYAPDKVGESGIVQDAIDKYTTDAKLKLSDDETIGQQMAISDKSMEFEPFYHAMVTDATKLILPNTKKTSEELGALWDDFIAQYKRIIDPELSDLGYGDQDMVYQLKEQSELRCIFGRTHVLAPFNSRAARTLHSNVHFSKIQSTHAYL